eukprot:2203509-Amphidinium_carterae.1
MSGAPSKEVEVKTSSHLWPFVVMGVCALRMVAEPEPSGHMPDTKVFQNLAVWTAQDTTHEELKRCLAELFVDPVVCKSRLPQLWAAILWAKIALFACF